MAVTEKDVRTALKQVKDPELGLDLVVLGLIYDIEIEGADVKATISLTSPFCPVAGQIVEDEKAAIEGIAVVEVDRPNRQARRRTAVDAGAHRPADPRLAGALRRHLLHYFVRRDESVINTER